MRLPFLIPAANKDMSTSSCKPSPHLGVARSNPRVKNQSVRGKASPSRGQAPLALEGAAMENVKQLLTSYLELMEKGESAAGWKESVRYFHSAAELADKIKRLSRSTGQVAS